MTASPNAQKQQAAKQLMFIREKYSLSANGGDNNGGTDLDHDPWGGTNSDE